MRYNFFSKMNWCSFLLRKRAGAYGDYLDGCRILAHLPLAAYHTERTHFLEAIVEQINHRLNSINGRLNNMDNRFTNVENRINSNFKWLVGLLITVLLANIGTAITIIFTLNKP